MKHIADNAYNASYFHFITFAIQIMCLQYGNDTCNVSLILFDGSECFDMCIHKYKTAFLQNHSLHRRNKNT